MSLVFTGIAKCTSVFCLYTTNCSPTRDNKHTWLCKERWLVIVCAISTERRACVLPSWMAMACACIMLGQRALWSLPDDGRSYLSLPTLSVLPSSTAVPTDRVSCPACEDDQMLD